MTTRPSTALVLWALSFAACSSGDGTDTEADGRSDAGSDAGTDAQPDTALDTGSRGAWALPTLHSTETSSLSIRAVGLPDGLGSAIAELDSETLLLPAVGEVHLCRTTTRFCDDRSTVALDWEGEWILGRPTAVHARSGPVWVAYENGLVAIDLDSGSMRVLEHFDSPRNTTAITPIWDADGEAYLLLSGMAFEPRLEEFLESGEEGAKRVWLGAPLTLVSLDDPGYTAGYGFEVSFDALAVSAEVVVVGDDFGRDILCRVEARELACTREEGDSTMGLETLSGAGPFEAAPGETLLLATDFDLVSVIRVNPEMNRFTHEELRTESVANGSTSTVFWGAEVLGDGERLILSSGGFNAEVDHVFGFPTAPCFSVFQWERSDEGRYRNLTHECLSKRSGDQSYLAAREVFQIAPNTYVGWPHFGAWTANEMPYVWLVDESL